MTVFDAFDCVKQDSVTITVGTPPVVSAGPGLSICRNSNIALQGAVTDGTPPYTIKWSPSTGLSDPTIATPVASPITSTTYKLLVTDKTGCTSLDSMRVTVDDTLTPQIFGNSFVCLGDTSTLSAPGYASYKWSTGETTPTIRAHTRGQYSVQVTNSSGCSGSTWTYLDVKPDSAPHPLIAASAQAICDGESTAL